MAVRPTVIQLASTKAPPNLFTSPFQDTRIITGTMRIRINDFRFRHCVVKSARNSERITTLLEGSVMDVIIIFLWPDLLSGQADKDVFKGNFSTSGNTNHF